MDYIEQLRRDLDDAFPREAIDLSALRRVLKDAERYRWLRDEEGAHAIFSALYFNTQTPEQLDAELDAAIERARAVG